VGEVIITLERIVSDDILKIIQSDDFLGRLDRANEFSENFDDYAEFYVVRERLMPDIMYTRIRCGEPKTEPQRCGLVESAERKIEAREDITQEESQALQHWDEMYEQAREEFVYPYDTPNDLRLTDCIGFGIISVHVNADYEIRPGIATSFDGQYACNPVELGIVQRGKEYHFIAQQVNLDRVDEDAVQMMATQPHRTYKWKIPATVGSFMYDSRKKEWEGLENMSKFSIDIFEVFWADPDEDPSV